MHKLTMLTESAKVLAKKLFLRCGLDIQLVRRKYAWLKKRSIRTVFDVGANIGSFSVMCHGILPEATIYAFEPLRDCYDKLVNSMKDVPEFHAFECALGSEDRQATMHRSEYAQSSSLLSMGELHKTAFPFSARTSCVEVEIRRLDSVASDLAIADNILVKLDVQGFEDQVIAGGRGVLSRANVLIVETSFRELYEGQSLFGEVYDMLCELGFSYNGCLGQVVHPEDGSALQADSVFLRM